MVRKESESMPKAEPITTTANQDEEPSPSQNLVEYIRLNGISMLAVHGSNSGTAEKYANELCKDAEDRKFDCLSVNSEDLFADDLPRLSEFDNMFVVFFMSTYDGNPSTNSKKLYDWIQQDSNITPGLRFAVYGVGDKTYSENFNTIAKNFDERLEILGGKKLTCVGLGDTSEKDSDVSKNQDYSEWRISLWNEVDKIICPIDCSKFDTKTDSCRSECDKITLVDRINEKKATVLIICGCESDVGENYSKELENKASNSGFSTISISAEELTLDDIPKLSAIENLVLVLCISAESTGKTASIAEKFLDRVEEGKSGLDGLKYAIFALGDKNDDDMIKKLNTKLESLGGKRVYELGIGCENESKDDSSRLPEDFTKWNDGLWTAVKQSSA